MKEELLKRLLSLVGKTGDRLVITDPSLEQAYVLMSLEHYEKLVVGEWQPEVVRHEPAPPQALPISLIPPDNRPPKRDPAAANAARLLSTPTAPPAPAAPPAAPPILAAEAPAAPPTPAVPRPPQIPLLRPQAAPFPGTKPATPSVTPRPTSPPPPPTPPSPAPFPEIPLETEGEEQFYLEPLE